MSKRQYFAIQSVLAKHLKNAVVVNRVLRGNGGWEWSKIAREASEPWEHQLKSMVKSGVLSSRAACFVHTQIKMREFLLVNPIYTEYLENPKKQDPMKLEIVRQFKAFLKKRNMPKRHK